MSASAAQDPPGSGWGSEVTGQTTGLQVVACPVPAPLPSQVKPNEAISQRQGVLGHGASVPRGAGLGRGQRLPPVPTNRGYHWTEVQSTGDVRY